MTQVVPGIRGTKGQCAIWRQQTPNCIQKILRPVKVLDEVEGCDHVITAWILLREFIDGCLSYSWSNCRFCCGDGGGRKFQPLNVVAFPFGNLEKVPARTTHVEEAAWPEVRPHSVHAPVEMFCFHLSSGNVFAVV